MNIWLTFSPLFILSAAALDDLVTRRVHNHLLGVFSILSLGIALWVFRENLGVGFLYSLSGLGMGLLFYLPLAWFGVVGGGDMKLLAVVGLTAGPYATATIGLLALLWGAVLGVIQMALKGGLKKLFANTLAIVRLQKIEKTELHKIPFAVAMLLAGLTQFTLRGRL